MSGSRLAAAAAQFLLTDTIWILDPEARTLREVSLEQYAEGADNDTGEQDRCRVFLEHSRAVAALEALRRAS